MFKLSREQWQLRDSVRDFLAATSPVSEARRLMAAGDSHDPAVWHRLAGELGLVGMGIPEDYGGSGAGPVERMIAAMEMGRVLLCAPYLASAVLAANALVHCGDAGAQRDLLPGIAAGNTIASLAVAEDDGVWRAEGGWTRAARTGTAVTLTGRKSLVPDGHVADLLLVVAQADAGPSLYAVTGDARGVTRRLAASADPASRLATVEFDGAAAHPVGAAGSAPAVVGRTVMLGRAALAAEQAGGAQRCLELAVAYAKVREQFGRPIGGFQSIMHKCADMAVEVESATVSAHYAALAAAGGAGDLPLAATMAAACCGAAFEHAAAESIQVHGAAGFTADHDAHLFYQRALASQRVFGGQHHYGAAVTGAVLAGGPIQSRWPSMR